MRLKIKFLISSDIGVKTPSRDNSVVEFSIVAILNAK